MQIVSEAKKYVLRVRLFSRNAWLYLVATSLQGLSFGIWMVIFNLYLKSINFQLDFAGNMSAVNCIATGLIALPAGLLCEHIGPKRATLISLASNLFNLVQIVFLQSSVLLFASLASGLVGTIGWVASAPLLTENSQQEERTYLFSIYWVLMTFMGVIGSFAGGVMPDIFNAALGLSSSTEIGSPTGYRITLIVATALALAATVPILLIKENKAVQRQKVGALLSLKNIKNQSTIIKFMIPTGIIGFGAGFIVPLVNLFFSNKFYATNEQIGIIFALSNIVLGIFTFVAPVLASRVGKVKAVLICQFSSMPFIMLITLAPNLTLATGAYLIRVALMNMAGPITSAFQMEMVSESERATTSGLMVMADNIPRGITVSISGGMMNISDFYTPFLFTTVTYFLAGLLFFVFFRKAESDSTRTSN